MIQLDLRHPEVHHHRHPDLNHNPVPLTAGSDGVYDLADLLICGIDRPGDSILFAATSCRPNASSLFHGPDLTQIFFFDGQVLAITNRQVASSDPALSH